MDNAKQVQQQPLAKDTRSQPWREWVKEELDARKKADETPEGRKALEEKAKAYFIKKDEDESEANDSDPHAGNKAG